MTIHLWKNAPMQFIIDPVVFHQQMALCSHWINSICCWKELNLCEFWARGDGCFCTKTIRDNLKQDIKGNPAVRSGVGLPFAGAHNPEHSELFMPELTVEPRSSLHCHSDPNSAESVYETAETENIFYTNSWISLYIHMHSKNLMLLYKLFQEHGLTW